MRDGHVKLLKCAGPQKVAEALTKSLPRPALSKHRQYMWGTYSFFSFLSLSQDWTAPDGVLQYRHPIPSRTRRLRNISSVCARVCICVCVCRYDPRCHDRPFIGVPSSYLIHGHASCLPGRSPSSDVHHFGLAKLDKKYFSFGGSLKDLSTYIIVLQRYGKITRLASS